MIQHHANLSNSPTLRFDFKGNTVWKVLHVQANLIYSCPPSSTAFVWIEARQADGTFIWRCMELLVVNTNIMAQVQAYLLLNAAVLLPEHRIENDYTDVADQYADVYIQCALPAVTIPRDGYLLAYVVNYLNNAGGIIDPLTAWSNVDCSLEVQNQSDITRANPGRAFGFLAALGLAAALVTGCSHWSATVIDSGPDGTLRESKTKAFTLFDAKSDLARLTVQQRGTNQAIGLGALAQDSSSTNLNALIEGVVGAAIRAAK